MENAFESKVNKQIEQFEQQAYSTLEAEVAKKRIAWFQEHIPEKNRTPLSPRKAYELFFFEYIGLSESGVPVIFETPTRIVWNSFNRCSTLEACQRSGRDTREVCRAVYEKPTQAFVSQLDPQLRFHRSYQEIRPHAPYCREMIIRLDFEAMMKLALEEAKQSRSEGNKGHGAVVVFEGQVVGKAHDTAVTENDPSLHAEMNAIRQAVRTLGDRNLCGAILFSTCEPCPMCTSLAIWANVTTIVYGISIEETARLGKSRILIPSTEIIQKSPVMIEVIGNVLKDECKQLYI
ncbi:CMP/dCMP deaminase, zinc-binding [Candidatus Vecturithrix granuli]|uniref:CMP/dCMP deaminase, zinc-binding n=1 Tax=Vecturithrix granuli TaxID=1499967 RepID=A0A081C2E7_VECG1|nr:CMP/dCMP deaminase, zinc-binding [Candidatus Vecturithrix granuli]